MGDEAIFMTLQNAINRGYLFYINAAKPAINQQQQPVSLKLYLVRAI